MGVSSDVSWVGASPPSLRLGNSCLSPARAPLAAHGLTPLEFGVVILPAGANFLPAFAGEALRIRLSVPERENFIDLLVWVVAANVAHARPDIG